MEDIQLNVPLLRRRVPNLTVSARSVGLRPATVSNLCTGKIPIGKAEVRTLAALATLAGCSLDELIIRGNRGSFVETGIKSVDVFAPIIRGGITGFVARHGEGQLVLLAEIFHRVKRRDFRPAFWLSSTDNPELAEVLSESELTSTSMDVICEFVSSTQSEKDVILGMDREKVLSGDLIRLLERIRVPGSRPTTIVLVDTRWEAPDEDVPYGPLDTLIRFDTDLVARGLFPAIDPVQSTSILHEGAHLETFHLTVLQRSKKLLRRYRELRALVRVLGVDGIHEADREIYQTGERLEAFLTQPFYAAEPFTGRDGTWVSPRESLEDIQSILDGQTSTVGVPDLTYIGRLPS